MNATDVLTYGHQTVLTTLDSVPMTEWETGGVCGVWSVKNIVAHLTAYEWLLAEVLETYVDTIPTPLLDELIGGGAFNDDQVAQRQSLSPADTLAEYKAGQAKVMAVIARISADSLRQPGTIPWYGPAYAIDDLIVYNYYGHKREHMAQVSLFRDKLG